MAHVAVMEWENSHERLDPGDLFISIPNSCSSRAVSALEGPVPSLSRASLHVPTSSISASRSEAQAAVDEAGTVASTPYLNRFILCCSNFWIVLLTWYLAMANWFQDLVLGRWAESRLTPVR